MKNVLGSPEPSFVKIFSFYLTRENAMEIADYLLKECKKLEGKEKGNGMWYENLVKLNLIK